MNRRMFIRTTLAALAMMALPRSPFAAAEGTTIAPIRKSEDEWRRILSPQQFQVLREAGTERAFSSPLNKEYGKGIYVCAGCQLPLFDSASKFDSGTGWPSFTMPISGHVETSRDFKLILPRTEYHCSRCGGHQGHVFDDGPAPTGQRWCNNGVALKFIPHTPA
ncbi:peptide-methionine (R)-S-oxide reductase MsrB [Mariprofundus erugo]|uniref:peptide-methionine (R)-S-oxide reductase n=1 Tax=Mariprofundus erugo TaxID=2528639 RepID=A0A5R9GS13_9PROT|nr:peptide-methionine (R)-S-oxide reductase MsrB [Mariprofundus erugo]TLS67057.1 peptide-methionine (R)-S-oxide reductase MsrB [Mariprofundus erugo]